MSEIIHLRDYKVARRVQLQQVGEPPLQHARVYRERLNDGRFLYSVVVQALHGPATVVARNEAHAFVIAKSLEAGLADREGL